MNETVTKRTFKSDLERVRNMTDEEIDTSDIPPLGDEFFANAKLWVPPETVTLTVDHDVLEWFKAQGEEYSLRMNAALRIYAEAHKRVA